MCFSHHYVIVVILHIICKSSWQSYEINDSIMSPFVATVSIIQFICFGACDGLFDVESTMLFGRLDRPMPYIYIYIYTYSDSLF